MSTYGVMRQIRQWYVERDVTDWAREATVDELLERCELLTREEAEALVERRIDILYDRGVHPMSLIQMSRVMGFDIATRWSEVRAAS